MKNFTRLMLVTGLFMLVARPGWAQTVYGSMAGTVTDASGGAIPDATVTLANIGTNDTRTMQSEASGSYTFVNILPGNYRLEAQKTGFKAFKRENILVEVGSSFKIDIQMQVGAISQTVEVTSTTPLLQAQSSDLGQVVESRTVTEMPLNGRNVLALVQLSPGVQPQGPPSAGNSSMSNPVGANPFAAGDFQIGGSQAGQNAVFVDGVPTNGSYLNVITMIPTQDAIQEFKVQTSAMEADFGRFAGGVINMTTKSGTNSWHGGGYEFLRNKVLDANSFFLNASGTPRGPWTQNQFGANVGGKVIRDKLFVFSSYEGYRVRSSAVLSNGIVPTAAEASGDFSALGYKIYDPTTSGVCTATSGTCRTQVGLEPGGSGTPNVLAASQINPASKVLLGYYPQPNFSSPTSPYNFITSYGTGGDTDQANEKVDWNVSDRQRFMARFTYYDLLNLPDSPFKDICTDRCTETVKTKQIALGDTLTFSPTTILDLHLGYTRYHYVRTPLTSGFNMSSLGGQWGTYPFASTPLPVPCVSQNTGDDLLGSGFCSQGTGSEIGAGDDTWSFSPSLTKIKGVHTLKFGYEYRLLRNNYYQTNIPTGLYQFDRLMTSANPIASPITTGNGFASFLLGYGGNNNGGAVVTPSYMASQITYNAMYVQDTWQATRKLTLNLGLRYDIQTNWTERFNRIAVWNPAETSSLAGKASPVTGAAVPSSLKGAFDLVASSTRASRNEQDTPWTEFNPRIGLAYRLNEKTVIRTGYGIFYLPNDISWNNAPHNLAMNTSSTAWFATLNNNGYVPLNNFSAPFPNGLTLPVGRNLAAINTSANGPSYPVATNPAGYSQEWNFNIQRQLPNGVLLDVAYAGQKGTHLPMHSQDQDQLPDADLPGGANRYTVAQLKGQVANPYDGLVTGGLTSPTVQFAQTLLPFPQFTDVSIAEPWDRDSVYNSFQMKVEKRFSHGASAFASYTISKLISNTNNEINWLGDAAPSWGDVDAYNLKNERSLDGFDVPQRLVLGYVLDLPFGKGQKYASGLNGVASRLVGGWGIDGIITLQSGFPLNIGGGSNALCNTGITNIGGCRVTRTGPDQETSGSAVSRLNDWFNASTFTSTTALTRGNDSRTEPDLRQQGENNWDFAVFKNTRFGPDEKLGLEFRAEFFNFFNHPQFAAPNTSCCTTDGTNPSFGVVSSQYNLPRLIQFGLRFTF
jgi:outer membrane receptor protein involved in Fe transport